MIYLKKLYIGLGGIGGSIVNKLSVSMNKEYAEFFYIDWLCESYHNNSINVKTINFAIPNSVGEILECFPDTKEWFSNLSVIRHWTGPNERIVARLYFEIYLKSHNLLENIFTEDYNNDLEINIITTSFGATGSGILWSLIISIKEYLCKVENAIHKINVLVILPESIEDRIVSFAEKNIYKIRTYAFLREMFTLNKHFTSDNHCENIISNMFCCDLHKESLYFIDNAVFYDKKALENNDYIKEILAIISNNAKSAREENHLITEAINMISQRYKTMYDEYICELNMDNQRTITPHLDKIWHISLFPISNN